MGRGLLLGGWVTRLLGEGGKVDLWGDGHLYYVWVGDCGVAMSLFRALEPRSVMLGGAGDIMTAWSLDSPYLGCRLTLIHGF